MEDCVKANGRHGGWDLHESGDQEAKHTVLLLAGSLLTGGAYRELLGQPALGRASVRVVAATLPGYGRTDYPSDLSVESSALMASGLAADLGARAVVGHGMGANVALEMAAGGGYDGPVILLSPSLSREDESRGSIALDRLGRVFGPVPWYVLLNFVGHTARHSVGADALPPEARDRLVAELRNNDARFLAKSHRRYLEYLDRNGPLVERLCDSGVQALVVFAAHDHVGITEQERRRIARCRRVVLRTISNTGHMLPLERPAIVAKLIAETFSKSGWLPQRAARPHAA